MDKETRVQLCLKVHKTAVARLHEALRDTTPNEISFVPAYLLWVKHAREELENAKR